MRHAFRKNPLVWLTAAWLAGMAFFSAGVGFASVPDTYSATSLHAKYASLEARLQHNPFRRPLALDSSESANESKGDIYALVDFPFSTVRDGLNGAEDWCGVLILHLNTKYCHATAAELTVYIGKKNPQPIKNAYPIEFSYRSVAATDKYLEIQLDAQEGPLSTRDYHIRLQAVPVANDRTFLHLTYSYAYGLAGRLAMKAYLATIGSGKVGFTPIRTLPNGQPNYIGGMRGLAERNTMRYYLAIEAYLGTLATPPPLQLQQRLHSWFTATEQYPRQLRELNRAAYIDMKRSEYLRQQTAR